MSRTVSASAKRLLEERPEALGLAVPGMEMGGRRDRYETLLIGRDSAAPVFRTHG